MPTRHLLARTTLIATITAAAGAGVACSAVRSRFASHEDVFPPVALTIGDLRVIGSDTAYVLAGQGYVLIAPSRELLPDAQQALDGAERAFKRYLSADPARVVVDLRPRSDTGAAWSDRAAGYGDTVVVRVPKLRRERGARDAMSPNRGRFVAPPVVRAWLTSYAAGPIRQRVGADSAGDSTSRAWGRNGRIPDWIEEAVPVLVAESPAADFAAALLARQSNELIPLRALFDSSRATPAHTGPERADGPDAHSTGDATPATPERTGEPGRARRVIAGNGRVDRSAIFALQSVAVFQFLIDRAGQPFVGEVTERALRGERMDDILRSAQGLPKTVGGLEAAWRAWLTEQRSGSRSRGPGGGR